MIKRIFKSLLLMMMISPFASLAMESDQDKIELGKQLLEASEKKDWATVENLIAQGADPNQKDETDWTALIFASMDGHQDIVQMLITAGADINMRSTAGNAPLMFASREGHREIVQLLITAGANLNFQNGNDGSALTWAAQYDNLPIAHILVDAMLKQNIERKERVSTFLLCLVRLYSGQLSNLKHLFKPFRQDMFGEQINILQEIDRIKNIEIKNQLIEKYCFQPISNAEAQQ